MVDNKYAPLIAAVAAKLHILIEEDDPAIVIIELNRLILDQAIREMLQALRVTESRLSKFPQQTIPSADAIAAIVAKSVSNSVITTLRTTDPTLDMVRNLPKLDPDRNKRAWTFLSAAAAVVALILSAVALAFSLHIVPE